MQFPGRRRGRRSVQKNILPRGKATNNVSCSPPITSSLCPTSRATMATINPEDCFQKKSFLIRDILSQTSKAYDNSSRTENGKGNMIDWMFLNPPHQPGGLQDLFRHNSVRGLNKSVIHKGADASMNNVNEDEDGQLILTDQLQARLYQNLCYYALQQQIICGGRPVLTSSSSSSIASSLPTDQNDQQFNFEKNSKNQSNEETRALPILSSTSATTVCRRNLTNQNLSKKRTSKAMKPINKMTVKLANKAQSFVRRQAPPSSIGPKPIKMISKNSNITNHEQEKHSNHNNSQNSLEMIMNMSNDLLEENDNHCNAGKNQKKFHKIRRNRTVFTELQLMGLERRFDSQKYLSTPDRTDLARALGLTQLQVKTWYQNRRMKWKKQVMQNGCPFPPTKPKGRPKKDSIPTYGLEFTNSILCPLMASVRSTNNHQDDDVDAHAEDD